MKTTLLPCLLIGAFLALTQPECLAQGSKPPINDARRVKIISPERAWEPDYEILADSIKRHENSVKFPYGCEHRVNGALVGYQEADARVKCIALCKSRYLVWQKEGGNYFQVLGKKYAADPKWFLSVQKIYASKI